MDKTKRLLFAEEPFYFVARPGFEPRQTVPKTVVLPLYYRARTHFRAESGCKFNHAFEECKYIFFKDTILALRI
jgi:hypothetical protein